MNGELLLETLTALAQLAMKDAGAAGYGLYRLDQSGVRVRLHTCGACVAGFGLAAELKSAVSLPARVVGIDTHVLTFVFRSATVSRNALAVLEQTVAMVEGVLRLSLLRVRYAELASEAAELEAQLSYAKIRDRARGLFSTPPGESLGMDALIKFTETMLRPRESAMVLEQMTAARRAEVEERSLTAQAKTVLESVYGMSEEQAHYHLRITSRRSRRPLKDVALEYIGRRA